MSRTQLILEAESLHPTAWTCWHDSPVTPVKSEKKKEKKKNIYIYIYMYVCMYVYGLSVPAEPAIKAQSNGEKGKSRISPLIH